MDLHEALYTTRAMRRVLPDPIPMEAQARILDAAVRAPSGGNGQNWRFMLVDDNDKIAALAPLYRDSIEQLWGTVYRSEIEAALADPLAPSSIAFQRVQRSATWLAEHFDQVPLLLFAFSRFDPTGSSIYPAVWSAMLAARAEGVGSCLTLVLSIFHPTETLEILGAPSDGSWQMSACVSLGYPTGRWGVAERRAVQHVAHRNTWGSPIGFEIDEPLWPSGTVRPSVA